MTVAPDRSPEVVDVGSSGVADSGGGSVLQRAAGDPHGREGRPWAAGATAGGAVVVGLVAIVWQARRIWFFGDDWNFMFGRSLSADLGAALFQPHNEHWSTVPVLVYRALYTVFGVRHFLPYMGPVVLAHLVVCAMVWILSRRAGAAPWAAVAAVVLVSFAGVGAEDLEWAFQVGFVGSIAFGLLAVWAADHRGGRPIRDLAAILAAVLAFASSGMGLMVWFLLVLLVMARRGWRATFVVAGVPAVVYALWFLTYGRAGVADDTSGKTDYLLLPQFVARGLSTAWGGALGVPDAGPAVVVLAAIAVLTAGRSATVRFRDLRHLALAAAATSVFLYASIGVSRLRGGVELATASRYAYPVAVFGALGVAALLTVLTSAGDARSQAVAPTPEGTSARSRRPVSFGLALGVALVLVAVSGVQQLVAFTDSRVALQAGIRPQIVGAVVLARQGVPVLSQLPDPMYSGDVTMDVLSSTSVQQAFGPVTATPQELLDARAAVQTGVRTEDPGLPAPAALTWGGVTGGAVPTTSGCASGDARPASVIEVTPGASGRAQVRLQGAGPSVQIRLTAAGMTSTTTFRTVEQDEVWVGTLVPDAVLQVFVLQDAHISVCAGALASK